MTTNRAGAPSGRRDREPALEDILRETGRDDSFTVGDLALSNPGFESGEEIDESIAALCITHDIPPATLNLKGFEDFEVHHGLRIVRP